MKEIENVLSLFDGMSNGQLALNRAGIAYKNYYASEIDKYAMKVTMANYPNTIQLGDVSALEAHKLPVIDLLIGGSPCQNFSFSGKREGMVTEDNYVIEDLSSYLLLKHAGTKFKGQSYLFWEYVRILREVNPTYFLLENVKMTKANQDIISKALGVEPVEINSALVSAQNRKRLYWTNIPNVTQPENKGIYLKDILESGAAPYPLATSEDKSYCLTARYQGDELSNTIHRRQKTMVIDTKDLVPLDKHSSQDELQCVAGLLKNRKWLEDGKSLQRNFSQGERVYSPDGKCPTLSANSGGTAGTGNTLILDNIDKYILDPKYWATEQFIDKVAQHYDNQIDSNEQPNRIGEFGSGGQGAKTGLYFCVASRGRYNPDGSGTSQNLEPRFDGKTNTLTTVQKDNLVAYIRENFIVRKLTPVECERLQTVPDNYTNHVSDTQRYKMLGNGWTVDIIAHIFKGLKDERD